MDDLKKYYEILGCDEFATDDEVRAAYLALRKQCQNDMFLEGEAGNAAARKLTEVQTAYDEICDYRKENASAGGNGGEAFKRLDELIKSNQITEAQSLLDSFNDRNAEWHYYQSVVFYKKNWINESKKQLEIAMQMDSSNDKYKRAYDKMCKQMDFNSANQKEKSADWNKSGSGRGAAGGYEEPTEMMGGEGCMDFCVRMAVCNLFLNCCCNCR